MHFARPRPWDWLTALAGLVLLASLWAPWYTQYGISLTGWERLGFTDLWLTLLAALAIALPLITAARDSASVPLVVNIAALTVGLVAIVLAAVALVFVPDFLGITVSFDTAGTPPDGTIGRGWGMWLASAATLVTFYASYRALRDDRAPDVRPAPQAVRMPAPPAAG